MWCWYELGGEWIQNRQWKGDLGCGKPIISAALCVSGGGEAQRAQSSLVVRRAFVQQAVCLQSAHSSDVTIAPGQVDSVSHVHRHAATRWSAAAAYGPGRHTSPKCLLIFFFRSGTLVSLRPWLASRKLTNGRWKWGIEGRGEKMTPTHPPPPKLPAVPPLSTTFFAGRKRGQKIETKMNKRRLW